MSRTVLLVMDIVMDLSRSVARSLAGPGPVGRAGNWAPREAVAQSQNAPHVAVTLRRAQRDAGGQIEKLRRDRRRLVGRLHHLTGREHQDINAQINQLASNGKSARESSLQELQAGNRLLEQLVADAGTQAA